MQRGLVLQVMVNIAGIAHTGMTRLLELSLLLALPVVFLFLPTGPLPAAFPFPLSWSANQGLEPLQSQVTSL